MPAPRAQPRQQPILSAIRGSPVPTVLVTADSNDEQHRILAVSRSFEAVYGPDGLERRNLAELWKHVCPAADRSGLTKRWQAALTAASLAGAASIVPVSARLADRMGQVRNVSLHFGMGGRDRLLVVEELPSSRAVERPASGLRAAQAPAERAPEEPGRDAQRLEALGQLSAGVAHNFNNVLTAILPNLELALKEVRPSTAELLQNARDAALHAAGLVRQLMRFARPREECPSPLDVNSLVRTTVQLCRATFDRSIQLEVVPAREPQPVALERNQFEQTLLNLLLNARDAVSEASVGDPRVCVQVSTVPAENVALSANGLEASQPHVLVSVVDNGTGMSEETRQRIFEPFFSTKEGGRGSGLGLSTARSIVDELSGAITCRSAPGAGSRFDVFLPLSKQPSAEQPEDSTAPQGRREKILLVDDEKPVRTAVARLLERRGYRVQVAADGPSALAHFAGGRASHRFDLILLDLSMPGMPGRQVLGELRRLAPKTPIAYLTGYPQESGNADAWIEKPVVGDQLMHVVRSVLDAAR